MTMKFTLKVDPEHAIQAVITARRVLREYGPKTRHNCVVVSYQNRLNQEVATVAVWGDENHMRVYQAARDG